MIDAHVYENTAGGWNYRCTCGVMGHDVLTSGEALRRMEKHVERVHSRKNLRPPAGEHLGGTRRHHKRDTTNDMRVPDASPTCYPSNDATPPRSVDEGSPQQSPIAIPIAFVDVNNVLVVKEGRWKLFTDDELLLIGENLNAEWESETEDTRLGHFNPQIVALLEPMVLGINEELINRDLPPRN